MDKRTANIFKFAILTLIENGHSFELVNGQKETDENRSGVAGIGASEYHRKSDTLTLKVKSRSKLNGYAPNITYIDENLDLTDEKDHVRRIGKEQDEEQEEQPEQEGDA